jgi:hypothetical protein
MTCPARNNDAALSAFIAKKDEIDTMPARLQALSEDHFGAAPEDITWGHVGELASYGELLKRITDQALGRRARQMR